ncbi:MAG: FAD-dependent oxidoreductase [Planctomycetaceae bacterium]|jgi:NADPH-dependent 2,4-dienoyl-CoA reductase/sulfur reductase-like enzyme|nr:FAD-dependent oxidoreductase [Planctomycetaceae bacterium]
MSSDSAPRLVIIGAGPAGMTAAITLAEQGLPVTLVDQNPRPGGQIYRFPAVPPMVPRPPDRGALLRKRLLELPDRITVLANHDVVGCFPNHRLTVCGPEGFRMLEADHLILAPGAYEYVPPFPGWTLPGVMTPGAAQQLLKSQGVIPGRRILLAGTGPFLLVVALALYGAGVEVVGICETLRRRDVFWNLPGLLTDGDLRRQGFGLLKRIRQAGIPLLIGQIVTRAEGSERLERVLVAPCDGDWIPDHGRARPIAVDSLCVGYGFVPRLGLAQQAGCQLICGDQPGGWIPQVDAWGQTTVPGVWAAGDGAGVAGSLVAELAGRLVGLGIAANCGAITAPQAEQLADPVRRRLTRLGRFRRAVDALGRLRPGLSTLADEQTLVCRCEEIRRHEIDTAVSTGSVTLRSLKGATRLGMGPCQGRMCQPAAARRLADLGSCPLERSGPPTFRPPLVPVTLGDLAGTVAAAGEDTRP